MSRYELNARRLLCPLPVIRTQDLIKKLVPGDVVEVVATDRGVLNDIPTWSRINGHTVLEARQENGEVTIVIEVGGAS